MSALEKNAADPYRQPLPRTPASHNPLIYKQRIVGDWEINGSEPPYVWQIGSGPATASR